MYGIDADSQCTLPLQLSDFANCTALQAKVDPPNRLAIADSPQALSYLAPLVNATTYIARLGNSNQSVRASGWIPYIDLSQEQ